jgi:hypothetical protein
VVVTQPPFNLTIAQLREFLELEIGGKREIGVKAGATDGFLQVIGGIVPVRGWGVTVD